MDICINHNCTLICMQIKLPFEIEARCDSTISVISSSASQSAHVLLYGGQHKWAQQTVAETTLMILCMLTLNVNFTVIIRCKHSLPYGLHRYFLLCARAKGIVFVVVVHCPHKNHQMSKSRHSSEYPVLLRSPTVQINY